MSSAPAVSLPVHGRGAADNPGNRFERVHWEIDPGLDPAEQPAPDTIILCDTSRTIIATNDSPDVGFSASINPYRGCEHGCIYCYARPTHEYLGFSAGLDFESRIMAKMNAAALLRAELSSKKWRPQVLSISGVTDCYQPIERKLQLTRQCLEVLLEFRNPLGIITKSHLVTRDIDLLRPMTAYGGAVVLVSVTSLDPGVASKMEPRAASPARRLDALRELSAAGIPTGVMVAPVVPGLTDHEMPAILHAAAQAGAVCAGCTPLRLPGAVSDLFQRWTQTHFPDRADKILNRIRELRGGKLNDPNFGSRMRGQGIWAEQFQTMFRLARRRAGLDRPMAPLSTAAFRVPTAQMTLWPS